MDIETLREIASKFHNSIIELPHDLSKSDLKTLFLLIEDCRKMVLVECGIKGLDLNDDD